MVIVVKCGACSSGRMVQRWNKRNKNHFFGCSNYPQCTNTISEHEYRQLHHEEGCRIVGEHPHDNEYDMGDM